MRNADAHRMPRRRWPACCVGSRVACGSLPGSSLCADIEAHWADEAGDLLQWVYSHVKGHSQIKRKKLLTVLSLVRDSMRLTMVALSPDEL